MLVAALELPARFGQLDAALADTAALLRDAPCDLALLPECGLTGYVDDRGGFDPTPFAERIDGPTVQRLVQLARETQAVIAAPVIELDGSEVYNTCALVAAGGVLHRYRKRHPWFPEAWATPGDEPFSIFELSGLRVAIAICFDVHFLEHEAKDVLSRADLLLFSSAWVDDGPDDLRGPLLSDLASQFGCTIVNANWGPGSPRVRGQGWSRVVGPDGELARIDSNARSKAEPRRLDATIQVRSSG